MRWPPLVLACERWLFCDRGGTAVGASFFLTFAFAFPSQRLHLAAPIGLEEKPRDVLGVDASKSLVADEAELPGANKTHVAEWHNSLSGDVKAERLQKLILPSNEYRPEDDPARTLRWCDACGRRAEKAQVSQTCPRTFCLALSRRPNTHTSMHCTTGRRPVHRLRAHPRTRPINILFGRWLCFSGAPVGHATNSPPPPAPQPPPPPPPTRSWSLFTSGPTRIAAAAAACSTRTNIFQTALGSRYVMNP